MKPVAVAVLASVFASACSGGGGDSKTEGPTAPAKPTELAPANIVIYSTSGWTEAAFNERFGDAIRKKFPQITFTYIQSAKGTTYPDLIASKQDIDIIWESIGNFPRGPMTYGTHMDMTELMKLHSVDTSKIDAGMLDVIRKMGDGKLFAIPVINNTVITYYNKDIFDKFAIAYPKNDVTWDEVIELNKRLTRTDGGIQYIGFAMSHFFATNSFSLPYANAQTKKPTITEPGWRSLYQVYARLAESDGYKEVVRKANGVPAVNNFVKDKNVALLASLANVHMNNDMTGINWDVVKFPTYKELPQTGPQAYPTYFGVSATSKFKDHGMEVIKFLISNDYQLEASKRGILPAINTKEVKDVFAKDTPFSGKNVKISFYDKFAPVALRTIYDADVEKVYNTNIVKLMLGETDLNTLLRQAEEGAQKVINETATK
jgi:multiple sugar transport system substrate-binding protein